MWEKMKGKRRKEKRGENQERVKDDATDTFSLNPSQCSIHGSPSAPPPIFTDYRPLSSFKTTVQAPAPFPIMMFSPYTVSPGSTPSMHNNQGLLFPPAKPYIQIGARGNVTKYDGVQGRSLIHFENVKTNTILDELCGQEGFFTGKCCFIITYRNPEYICIEFR